MPTVPPPTQITGKLAQTLREALNSASALEDIVPASERVVLAVADDAAVDVIAGSGAVAPETVVAVSGAIAGFFDIPIILLVLGCVVLSRMTEGVLINLVVGAVPFGKNQLRSALMGYFSFINRIEDALVAFAVEQGRLLLHHFITLVGFALGYLGLELPTKIGPPRTTPGQVATEQQIQSLQREINQLRNEVRTVRYTVSGTNVVVGVPQTVWDQLHSMQAELFNQSKALRQIQSDIESLTDSGTATEKQVQELQSALHSVRAVTTTWGEVQRQLVTLEKSVTALTTSTQRDIHHLTATQTAMQPLTLLMGAGISGLKTLRQLEDTPCMCPQLPDIPGILADGLAVLEFLENG